VPVKDYISQGTLFALCIVILAERALAAWNDSRHGLALAYAALALAFLSNVVLVLDSRTPLAIIPPLLLFLAIKRMRGRWLLASLALVVVSAGVVGLAVPRVRDNIVGIVHEVQDYRSAHRPSRVGERLEFWKKSVGFIAEAPVIGHGTGSIESLFRRAAEGQTGVAAMVSSNPHNQFFGVVIQLGLVGGVVLIAFWIAHLWLFRGDGAVAWIGFAVVVQNVIGSLFNSHLFDFTHGWIYVLGVGVAAGVLRGQRGDAPSTARDEPRSAAS
jgi:O-antigen ligase